MLLPLVKAFQGQKIIISMRTEHFHWLTFLYKSNDAALIIKISLRLIAQIQQERIHVVDTWWLHEYIIPR